MVLEQFAPKQFLGQQPLGALTACSASIILLLMEMFAFDAFVTSIFATRQKC